MAFLIYAIMKNPQWNQEVWARVAQSLFVEFNPMEEEVTLTEEDVLKGYKAFKNIFENNTNFKILFE